MIPQKHLNDVFPQWMAGKGIFAAIDKMGAPWGSGMYTPGLDIEYHGNVSGEKMISPLVDKVCSGDTLTDAEIDTLANAILSLYHDNWTHLWGTLSLEYNPIENYSMTEQMTDDKTVTEYGRTSTRTDDLTHGKTGTESTKTDATDTRTDDLTHGKTGTETVTPDITETTTPNLTTNQNNTINGFNSSAGVPTGAQTSTATGTSTVTRTGTDTTTHNTQETDTGTQTIAKTGTGTITHNTQETDTGTQSTTDGGSDTHTRSYKLKRSGNIGVTTSQQMIESERNLWMWNFFRAVVFPDVDRVLTIQIY